MPAITVVMPTVTRHVLGQQCESEKKRTNDGEN